MFFFFNDTATTEIYTLSLHDALPICAQRARAAPGRGVRVRGRGSPTVRGDRDGGRRTPHRRSADSGRRRERRSEEHTSELQSRQYLVCRLLLEKKNIYQSTLHSLPSY